MLNHRCRTIDVERAHRAPRMWVQFEKTAQSSTRNCVRFNNRLDSADGLTSYIEEIVPFWRVFQNCNNVQQNGLTGDTNDRRFNTTLMSTQPL